MDVVLSLNGQFLCMGGIRYLSINLSAMMMLVVIGFDWDLRLGDLTGLACLPAIVGKEGSRNIPGGERAARLAVTRSSRSTSVMADDDDDDDDDDALALGLPVFPPNPPAFPVALAADDDAAAVGGTIV